jgi:hypothetical protein
MFLHKALKGWNKKKATLHQNDYKIIDMYQIDLCCDYETETRLKNHLSKSRLFERVTRKVSCDKGFELISLFRGDGQKYPNSMTE